MSEQNNNASKSNIPDKNKPAKAAKKNAKPGVFSRIAKWFRELKSEAKKVIWPSRKQVVNNTLVVMATVGVVGIFVWIVDFLLQQGVSMILRYL